MAVAQMKKLNLVAMSYDKDAVLNALHRTGAAEVKLHSQTERTLPLAADCEELGAYVSRTEAALEILAAKAETLADGAKKSAAAVEVSYSEFMSAGNAKAEMDALTESVYEAEENDKRVLAEIAKTEREISAAEIYSAVGLPLQPADSTHAKYRLGTVPAVLKDNLFEALKTLPLAACNVLAEDADNSLILLAAHKSAAAEAENVLQSVNFSNCPFAQDTTGERLYASLVEKKAGLAAEAEKSGARWAELCKGLRGLKIYCDYLGFQLEKSRLEDKLRATQTTFLLEAYVPAEAEELVKGALSSVSGAVYSEFSAPAEDEVPPTLLKNNKVVKNFEAVTNMYSPVNYREFDPNAVMAVFYSIFLGFIMADIGYGLLMFVLGGFLYLKSERDTGLKRLSGVFAIGGIFAVIWGVLFASFFGITLEFIPFRLPDAQKDMWSVMGIKIPAVLIISLLLGMVQLCAGYVCRAVQCWRRGKVADGIFDGMVWAVFTVGVAVAVTGMVEQFALPSAVVYAGGITAGATLVIAMLTAGRKEKLLGKFTKGFGAAYGVINFASDILSYARLYGLMLSGAVIAQIVSSYAVDFITGGNVALIILGVLLMVIGHAFNLAIGLLGAYIHDARLQYVEFYGRFYEGEGELFTPLGSSRKYVEIN